jgi:hypothetical protein
MAKFFSNAEEVSPFKALTKRSTGSTAFPALMRPLTVLITSRAFARCASDPRRAMTRCSICVVAGAEEGRRQSVSRSLDRQRS